uniref:W2 domain-containing protein n=1 Tax=Chaetoceros debilis TaxID=122233 RepID=A0A7S3V5E2_9STRA|mmetsp:Transcript_16723/g.24514  ORF Transcript_16723/g.24514 Transcript_16723/m.24514 type:complete len:408 (-) Transcript_16723:230-1453(-)|eukprot:CAMPEP_0194083738 /NCGR_PEP_ID=MMETSP0149-20130528/9734_1 /TAXON_ID=122233 /ORGANISM="Chaetoceros debilis, Strain MM31A-1" /LENGTH=407 /DNA_ID=CAMNT_0038766189 /DNA_START=418 /DNA_END=1641 /DNA_ORIENTATION=+
MVKIINISGTNPVEDPSYRYKMPSVMGKIEGKGNGIKTVIVNVYDLALSLHRDPGEVNKFFGCEMGAQTTYNETDDRAVVNGAHSDGELQGCVHKYVEKFVLCPNCGLPETEYKIKQGCIWHRCKACGSKDMVDMNHKLCTYILKKWKEDSKKKNKDKKKGKEEKDAADEKKDKKDKKKKKSKDKDSDSDDEKKKKSKKDKKKKDKKKDKKKEKKGSDVNELASDVDDLSVASETGLGDADVMNLAIQGVKSHLKNNPDASAAETAEVVVNQQMASALKSQDKVRIFLRAVLTPAFFKNKEIEKNAPTVAKIIQSNPIMQRHLIGAIEGMTIVDGFQDKHFPVMLKQLYDEDLLEEDVILEWAFDGRTDYTLAIVDEDARAGLRGLAEPVVAWLQNDSDSDSDSDSD